MWQSWSPVRPNYFHWPIRDYSPVPQIAPENQKPVGFKLKPPISGWCSWYAFGGNINNERLLSTAKKLKSKYSSLQYFLIDDGWCRWGDWNSPDQTKFPDFSQTLANVTQTGFQIGLWFAPFLIDPKSAIVTAHSDWLVRNKNGALVNGWQVFPFDNFFSKKYLLDFSKAPAKKYIYDSISRAIREWHVSLLKLDFLYAPYFDPSISDDLLPTKYLTELFVHLKEKFPQIYLMASGCPFKPARYLADSIRISKDISWPQLNRFPIINRLLRLHRFHLLKGKNTALIGNQKYFHFDPDVYSPDLPGSYYQQFNNVFFLGEKI